MKRIVRLTERDLTNLIKRVVKESMEMDSDFDMSDEMDFDMSDKMDFDMSDDMRMSGDEETDYNPRVIRRIARFFKQKLRRLDDEKIEDLQDLVLNPETENLAEMFLREDISDRRKSFKEKAMMRGGIGMMGAGMLGMVSQAMGYTDAGDLMIQVHDIVKSMGGGPVSAGMLISGLVMALQGAASLDDK